MRSICPECGMRMQDCMCAEFCDYCGSKWCGGECQDRPWEAAMDREDDRQAEAEYWDELNERGSNP